MVEDDPDARGSGSEWYEPDPVAAAHDVVRAEPSEREGDAFAPGRVVGEVIYVERRIDPEPHCTCIVFIRSPQAQLPLQEPRATARVYDPARAKRLGALDGADLDAVVLVSELDLRDLTSVAEIDSLSDADVSERVLQPTAIEL